MEDIINLVKLQNRWTTSAFDSLIKSKALSCQWDLRRIGIDAADNLDDPLIRDAIVTYCVMHTSNPDPAEYDRLKAAYDEMRGQLQCSTGYGLKG